MEQYIDRCLYLASGTQRQRHCSYRRLPWPPGIVMEPFAENQWAAAVCADNKSPLRNIWFPVVVRFPDYYPEAPPEIRFVCRAPTDMNLGAVWADLERRSIVGVLLWCQSVLSNATANRADVLNHLNFEEVVVPGYELAVFVSAQDGPAKSFVDACGDLGALRLILKCLV